jgi:hypothetical protein
LDTRTSQERLVQQRNAGISGKVRVETTYTRRPKRYSIRFWTRKRGTRVLARTVRGIRSGRGRRSSARSGQTSRDSNGRNLPSTHWDSGTTDPRLRDRQSVAKRVRAHDFHRKGSCAFTEGAEARTWLRARGLGRRDASLVGAFRRRREFNPSLDQPERRTAPVSRPLLGSLGFRASGPCGRHLHPTTHRAIPQSDDGACI